MRKTILCDVDGVLLDFTAKYLEIVQEHTGRVHREHEITSFNFHECIVSKAEDLKIWEQIAKTPGLVLGLPWYEGAQAFLEELRTLGRVVACTSPASPLWTAERSTWLLKSAGFDRKDIVICNDKALVRGDVLIDDALHNIQDWDNANDGLAMLLNRPWNMHTEHHTRLFTYEGVLEELRAL